MGDAAHNAQVVRDTFAGAGGAVRDAVLLNAGIALALTRPDSGDDDGAFHEDLRGAMALAAEAIDSGAASAAVDRWVAATRGLTVSHGLSEAERAGARRGPGVVEAEAEGSLEVVRRVGAEGDASTCRRRRSPC